MIREEEEEEEWMGGLIQPRFLVSTVPGLVMLCR